MGAYGRGVTVADFRRRAYTVILYLGGFIMAKRKEITYSIYIGDKKVDKLPEDYVDRMMERVGEVMSLYYRQHPDQYRRLVEAGVFVDAVPPSEGTGG